MAEKPTLQGGSPLPRVLLRWLLAVAMFFIGWTLIPVLIHLLWEFGMLTLPPLPWTSPIIELIKSATAGFAPVALVRHFAPSHERVAGIVAAFFIVVLAGFLAVWSEGSFSVFERVNIVLGGVAALLAAFIPSQGWFAKASSP